MASMRDVSQAARARSTLSVTLPLHCTSCLAPVRLTYRSKSGHDGMSVYTCPYCQQDIPIHLPGEILTVARDEARR